MIDYQYVDSDVGGRRNRLAIIVCILLLLIGGSSSDSQAQSQLTTLILDARVVAIGIPQVGGLRQVGHFHEGGAIPSNPEFAQMTAVGQVLDPVRLLVTSGSNYGAPLGIPSQAAGSVLSIDPDKEDPLIIPVQFAVDGGQATVLDGAVQLFTSQSPSFLNRFHNKSAVTAMHPGVANPRYISINNAFGRPWFANIPEGISGNGTSTVIDPTGHPLAGPPSQAAGGVFAGAQTNRPQQVISGALTPAAVGTAFMGISPDDSGFAVFAVVNADGAIVQVHVQDGVDGLVPSGTVAPLSSDYAEPNGIENGGVIGMAFNWIPAPILYVTDGENDQITALHLTDDGSVFHLAEQTDLTSDHFSNPVDLVPSLPEIANPRFSSHTTLAGGADLYVANRGDGTIVRVTQGGEVKAKAVIRLHEYGLLGADQLQGIAVSADGQRLWLTVSQPHPDYPELGGYIVEIPGFDAHGLYSGRRFTTTDTPLANPELIDDGRRAFERSFTIEDGLGPFFNQTSCAACHNQPTVGGMGTAPETMGVRIGFMDESTGEFDPMTGRGGPVVRFHSTASNTDLDSAVTGIPAQANVVSMRLAPALYGLDLIDQIPDEAIFAQAIDKGDGIHGRVNNLSGDSNTPVIGRYGWKADVATLDEMIAVALDNELGITSSIAPEPGRQLDIEDDDLGIEKALDDDGTLVRVLRAFIASLTIPEVNPSTGDPLTAEEGTP